MRKFIFAEKFLFGDSFTGPGYLELIDEKFGEYYLEVPSEKYILLDYKDHWIAPGLVDTHIHGFMNHDIMDNEKDGIKKISESLLSCGVTSFLPTTLTASDQLLNKVVKTIASVQNYVSGAKIQGIYLEGPFFTEKHKGAQNSLYFQYPNINVFNKWQESSGGIIKKIALAPEIKGAREFIKKVTKQHVVVSMGHSNASLEEARGAIHAGATIFVHAYNGMSSLNHYEPGMVGSLLTAKETYSELICDGHHVHPLAIQILMKNTDYKRIILITDCMRAGGMGDGIYSLGEFNVYVHKGVARLKTGNLAGSVLKLNEAAKNLVNWNLATPEQALTMSTLIPAISCNIDHKCGIIKAGRDADFIVVNKDMTLISTYLNGEKRYTYK